MLLNEWQLRLTFPPEDLILKMLDAYPQALEMRQVLPFSGVLSSKARTRCSLDLAEMEPP